MLFSQGRGRIAPPRFWKRGAGCGILRTGYSSPGKKLFKRAVLSALPPGAPAYVKVLSMGGGIIRQTITDDDLRAIAHDFGVTLNEKFLN